MDNFDSPLDINELEGTGSQEFGAEVEKTEEVDLGDAPAEEGVEESKEKPPRQPIQPYTVFLGIALVAIAIGVLLLFLEFGQYKFQLKPVSQQPATIASEMPA